MSIQTHTLDSSFLDACVYNQETKVLTVTFRNGKMYAFADVPPELVNDFVQAESPGQFFNGRIKGNFEAPKEE